MSESAATDIVRHIDTLRQMPLFRTLEPSVLSQLVGTGRFMEADAGATLLHEGEPAKAFYVLLNGSVTLYTIDVTGAMNTLSVSKPPTVVALTALFYARVYPATCEALEPSLVLQLPRRAVLDILMGEPGSRTAVLHTLAKSWDHLYHQCTLVRSKSPVQRLVGYVIGLSDASDDPRRIALPMTMQRLASQIGITSENLSRHFAKLEDYGVWRRNGGLEIEDPQRLRGLFAGGDDSAPTVNCPTAS